MSEKTETDRKAAEQELRKSRVRVVVTYLACAFIFGVGSILILCAAAYSGLTAAKDIFLAILPVATGVVTYWFADRSASKKSGGGDGDRGPTAT